MTASTKQVRVPLTSGQIEMAITSVKKWLKTAEDKGFDQSIVMANAALTKLLQKQNNPKPTATLLTEEELSTIHSSLGEDALFETHSETEVESMKKFAELIEQILEKKFEGTAKRRLIFQAHSWNNVLRKAHK